MKLILILILSLYIASCKSHPTQNKTTNIEFNDPVIEMYPVLGEWSLCTEQIDDQIIQANICSGVQFNSDGSGWKEFPSGIKETFRWQLNRGSLKIYSNHAIEQNSFPDTNYVILAGRDSDLLNLEIRQPEKHHSFFLSKMVRASYN